MSRSNRPPVKTKAQPSSRHYSLPSQWYQCAPNQKMQKNHPWASIPARRTPASLQLAIPISKSASTAAVVLGPATRPGEGGTWSVLVVVRRGMSKDSARGDVFLRSAWSEFFGRDCSTDGRSASDSVKLLFRLWLRPCLDRRVLGRRTGATKG